LSPFHEALTTILLGAAAADAGSQYSIFTPLRYHKPLIFDDEKFPGLAAANESGSASSAVDFWMKVRLDVT
jgi:hypothetical protein